MCSMCSQTRISNMSVCALAFVACMETAMYSSAAEMGRSSQPGALPRAPEAFGSWAPGFDPEVSETWV